MKFNKKHTKALFLFHLKDFVRNFLAKILKIQISIIKNTVIELQSKVSVRAIRKMIIDKGFAFTDGEVSWFYSAYSRGDKDPLTNFMLAFLKNNVRKKQPILITGAGTGIMAFHLADLGFSKISAFDYLQCCVDVAKQIH